MAKKESALSFDRMKVMDLLDRVMDGCPESRKLTTLYELISDIASFTPGKYCLTPYVALTSEQIEGLSLWERANLLFEISKRMNDATAYYARAVATLARQEEKGKEQNG